MKRICTKIATFCLLIIGQNLYAQSVSVSTSPITPTPGFTSPDSVKQANGFTSTNTGVGTFNEFAPNQTDTIVSPQFYYTTPQTTIYFDYNITVANPGDSYAAKVIIITAAGDTIPATANVQLYKGASVDYYFTFNLGKTLAANTNFKIELIFTIAKTDKAIRANTLTTNALLAGSQAPLPVNFTGFYAKKVNSNVLLTWNVAFEQNVNGYEVQRSADGSNFTKIGFVYANQSPSYNFSDSKPIAVAYYRIKSIDNDDSYKYSSIVSLKGQQSDVVLKAFPMPVQNELTIQYNTANSNSKIDILSADGRMIKSIALVSGSQEMKVDLTSAKAGVYFARFDNGNGQTQTLKVIKQ